MNKEFQFSETQRFSQWWIWLILLAINGVFLTGIGVQIFGGKPFGDKPMSDSGLIIMTLLMLGITFLIMSFRLQTLVDNQGISVRFFPFHIKFKFYAWENISNAIIREYVPIGEFGGWGIRQGFSANGRAYNVKGKIGLQLEFTNGEKLLIGTQKPEELEATIEKHFWEKGIVRSIHSA